MEEIRNNQALKIKFKNAVLDGIVLAYISDRVKILISDNSLEEAKNIKELDELDIIVDTHLGLKRMISLVISELNSKNNTIIVENSASVSVEQKRQHARVVSEFNFNISVNDKIYQVVSKNISAGGVAFLFSDVKLNINEIINIQLFEKDFEKDIFTQARIIKAENNVYVAKYINLAQNDEDKIVKHVFRLMAQS